MPFSFLSDPHEIARAHAAVAPVWTEIERLGIDLRGSPDGERTRAAQIVAGLLTQTPSDDGLVRLAVARFVDMNG